ncbi:hypothetical protein CAPTEDRAFT_206097 [Capitella teleta]|uniref:Neurotransmitter-gated ion-channel ligand-binding domain-containing protein n=1 Tax=Capitella teleta TaxID=283909 RepID=R7VA62_CAPTE|nr:hypothetical protein CAPTEDRAFT_206097 [Capitella teleta]|eukprot:ELU15693.1 hypothetical protein CAPTEDRAFT_206097 [Capitella teleta]
MRAIVILLTWICLSICSHIEAVGKRNSQASEDHLLNDLLQSVSRIVRPSYNSSVGVTVGLSLTPLYIDGIEEIGPEEAKLTVVGWLLYRWKDFHLQWNPEEYDGITEIRVPIDLIWKPDIVLYNNLDVELEVDGSALATIENFGTVLWAPRTKLRVLATKPVTSSSWMNWTPREYDWSAEFKFMSWAYDGFKLDLQLEGEEMHVWDFKSRTYSIVNHSANRTEVYYACCPEPFPSITYTIQLKLN